MVDEIKEIAGTLDQVESNIHVDGALAKTQTSEKMVPLLPVFISTPDESVILKNIVDYKSQEHSKRLMETLETFRRDGSFSDVHLVHGQEKILAHRLVLMAASKFFENALKDVRSNNKPASIDLSMMPKDVLYQLIDYIYTGKIIFSSQEPEEFLQCAKMFQLNHLMEQYLQFLLKHASPPDFCKILKLAHIFLPDNEDIKQKMEGILDMD